MKININNYVRIKLTARGRQVHRERHDEIRKVFPNAYPEYKAPEEDADGWSRWQLWEVMGIFGPNIFMGCIQPFETTIELCQ